MNFLILVYFFAFKISFILSQEKFRFYSNTLINNTVDSNYLIGEYFLSKIKCLSECDKNKKCHLISLSGKTACKLYKRNAFLNKVYSDGSGIYVKIKCLLTVKNGLVSYWPFCNHVKDVISGFELYNGVNAYLTSNAFGLPNSALSLKDGYYQAPPGIYFFGGDFTISVWYRPIQIRTYSRILDFGNYIGYNVVFTMIDNTLLPELLFLNGAYLYLSANTQLILGEWHYITGLIENNYAKIYINGLLDASLYLGISTVNSSRSTNYIGRSNWIGTNDQDAYSDMFDLKIYNKALSQSEIIDDMNGE